MKYFKTERKLFTAYRNVKVPKLLVTRARVTSGLFKLNTNCKTVGDAGDDTASGIFFTMRHYFSFKYYRCMALC